MSLIYHHGVSQGNISLNRFVELTSTASAKIFGLFPKKGTIAVGSDADIVIFDPEREETISAFNSRTHHMNIDYSAYEGFKVKGYTETVLSRGKVVIENGDYVGRPGDGAFVKRDAYGGHYANTHAKMVRDVLSPRGVSGRRVVAFPEIAKAAAAGRPYPILLRKWHRPETARLRGTAEQ